MPSLSTLHNSKEQLHSKHKSNLKLAEDLERSAETHRANGDDIRADLDQKSADRYKNDANITLTEIGAIEAEIQRRENKAQEISSKITALDDNYKRERQKLENDLQQAA